MQKCPVCNSTSIGYANDSYQFAGQLFKRMACRACDLHFWDPLEVNSAELYDEENIPLYKAYHQGLMGSPTSSPLFDSLPIKKGKLLDVGCANGGFMRYAMNRGYVAYGLDFDQRSIESARANGITNVWPMSLKEFSETTGRDMIGGFDVVTFFDVMEHQTDPARFINEVLHMLAPGGYIVGKVPNRNRILSKVRRELDYDYPPHHTLMWSISSVQSLLVKTGFKSVYVEVTPFKFWPYIWHMEKKIIGRGLKKAIKSRIFSVDRDVSYVPTEKLEAATGKSGGVVRTLKHIEDIAFAVMTGAMYPMLRGRGTHIHFMAQKV